MQVDVDVEVLPMNRGSKKISKYIIESMKTFLEIEDVFADRNYYGLPQEIEVE